MEDRNLLERIVLNPEVMAGKAIIRGTRLTVEHILNLSPLARALAHGESVETIMEEYPGVAKEDVLACILFAARTLEDTAFVPFAVETA